MKKRVLSILLAGMIAMQWIVPTLAEEITNEEEFLTEDSGELLDEGEFEVFEEPEEEELTEDFYRDESEAEFSEGELVEEAIETEEVEGIKDETISENFEIIESDPIEETVIEGESIIEEELDSEEVEQVGTVKDSGTCGENLTWTLTDDGVLTISGTGDMWNWLSVSSVPWGTKADNIEQIIIQNGVTSIGNYAFENCSSLLSITISNSVTSIGNYAFSGCSSLTSIRIPKGVISIGGRAFYHCTSLTNVTIPDSVTSIGSGAFNGCSVLTNITIPDSVTSIGMHAFDSCISLTSVKIPDGVTEILEGVFRNCQSLMSIKIPENVTKIQTIAFSNCISLTSVIIPSSVRLINGSAFQSCTNLKKITFIGDAPKFSNGSQFWRVTAIAYYPVSNPTWTEDVMKDYGGTITWKSYIPSPRVTLSETKINLYSGQTKTIRCYDLVAGDEIVSWKSLNNSIATVDNSGKITAKRCGETVVKVTLLSELTAEVQVIVDHTMAVDNRVEPTCTQPGLTEGSHCSVCNEIIVQQEEIPATDHIPVVDEAIAPTCTDTGLTEGTHCSVCGEVFIEQEEIPANGHTSSTDEAVEPTCTEIGLTEGSHCEVCGEVLIAQEEIPANGHTSVIDEAFEPTCTETGLTEGSHCEVCGEILVAQEEIPENGHTVVIEAAIEPTCTNPGLKEGRYCSVCGTVFAVQEEIPAKGHKPIRDERVEPTCTETGLTAGSHCSACGEIFVEQEEIPAKGHRSVKDEAVAPTCTKTGLTEGSHCSVCNEILVKQEVVPATGHTAVIDNKVNPTCTETGLTEGKHCSVCGTVLVPQSVIPANGHSPVSDNKVDPTCTETGLTEGSHCSVCGEILVAQKEVSAKGHTLVTDKAVSPTCTETGLTEGSHCSVCETILAPQKVVPANGHTIVIDSKKDPTCTETGLTEGSHCSVCNEILTAQKIISAKGHTEVIDKKVDSTCIETGLTEGKHCSVCKEVLVAQEVIPAKGHTPVIDKRVDPTCTETGLTEGSHCLVCEEVLIKQEVIEALGHKYGEWVAVKEPTAIEEGRNERICSVCKKKEEEKIPKLEPTIKLSTDSVTIPFFGSGTVEVSDLAKGDSIASWKSNNEAIATVKDGVIMAVSDGQTKVTVTLLSGLSADVEVTVTEPMISLDKASVTLIPNESEKITVSDLVEGDEVVSWRSSNTSIAIVDSEGAITAKRVGNTKVTVRLLSGVKAEVKVTVVAPTITVNPESVTLTAELSQKITVSNLVEGDKVVSFESSNTGIASVNSNGLITGKKAGSATVTVTLFSGKTAKVAVTVVKPTMRLSATSITLDVGKSQKITVSDLAVGDNISSWKFADTSVATVKSGLITGIKPGTTAVTVTLKSGHTGTVNVTVKETLQMPKLIAAYNGAHGIGVKFFKVHNASEYVIYQKFNGVWNPIRTISAASPELQAEGDRLMYTDKTVAKLYGKGYIYSVEAKKGSLVSGYNKTGVAIYRLNPPAISTAVNSAAGTAAVTWKSVFGKT